MDWQKEYFEILNSRLNTIEKKQDEILNIKAKAIGFSLGLTTALNILFAVLQSYFKLYK